MRRDKPGERSATLEERLAREAQYHDRKYVQDSGPFIYRANPTYFIFQRMKSMLGDVTGQRILEYGCGTGWITVELAALGAELHSFDISAEAVTQSRAWVSRVHPEARCQIEQMAAERLEYPNAHFDGVLGFAILHHLDLDLALADLYRVMKPGSRALFAEPLGTNPLINLYRRWTPSFRTRDERPLSVNSFVEKARMFRAVTHEEHYCLALAPLALQAFFGSRWLETALHACQEVDQRMFVAVPFTRRLAWYTVIVLER